MRRQIIPKRPALSIVRPGFAIGLFLLLGAVMVYWRIWHHDFIYLDDDIYVFRNPMLEKGIGIDTVQWAFATTWANFWHPLTWLSLLIDRSLFGNTPAGYHFTNMVIHLLNGLLLFKIVGRFGARIPAAGFVAGLFLLHPLHVESVAWIAERKDVLSAFFWMLTTWCYLVYAARPSPWRYVWMLIVFLLGLMAKPMLITLPLVLLLIDFWPLRRIPFNPPASQGNNFKRRFAGMIVEKIPLMVLAAAAALAVYLTQKAGGALEPMAAIPIGTRIANALTAYIAYAHQTVWPFNLSVFYPYPESIPFLKTFISAMLFILLTVLALSAYRRYPYVTVGWFWYVITLLPVIGLVQVGLHARADRYTYIPLIGLFIIAAWGIPDIARKSGIKKSSLALPAAFYILVLMSACRIQTTYWRNSVTLFRHAVAVTSRNYLIHHNLGTVLAQTGRQKEAIVHFSEALRIKPDNTSACYNLALAKLELGEIDEAIVYLEKTLTMAPGFVEARRSLRHAMKIKAGNDKTSAPDVKEQTGSPN